MMQKISILLLLSLALFGCEKVFLGDYEPNNPVNNFELFWQDFDQHYGLFQARGMDWDSIYQVYRPQVNAQTSDQELWNILKNMISYLDDGHTFIYSRSLRLFFPSGSELDSIVETEFDINLVKEKYLENYQNIAGTGSSPDDVYIFGKMKNTDVGYVYLNGIEADNKDFMDDVLAQIGHHKAIILDLRNNFGGDDITAEAIAGRFADGEHFIYTVQERNGPNHNDFTGKIKYYSGSKGSQHFSKPLIVLTDRITVSAAEILLLHLKSFAQVIQLGNTTAGDFSDTGMRRFLPNGWQYQYSIMMFLLPDGSTLDGIGHVPDIQIRNTTADIATGKDVVLEEALIFYQTMGGNTKGKNRYCEPGFTLKKVLATAQHSQCK
jgi:carboxyl-terminal processing protease